VVSVIGQDFMGTEVLWQLTGFGVQTQYIRTDWERTERTVILVAPGGERQLLCDFRDSATYRYPEDVLREALQSAGSWVYTSTHNWVRYAARVAQEMGKYVATDVHDVIDIDDYHRDFYQAADLIFVSMARLRPALADFARHLHEGFGVTTVVGMDGARGAWLVDAATGATTHFPAAQVEHVVDTVGAGDALAAGFCAALSCGIDLEACMRVAMRVAAHKIQFRGTLAFPTPEAVGLAARA
jgi:sugar/nucleoside kinase (ribokinase family)